MRVKKRRNMKLLGRIGLLLVFCLSVTTLTAQRNHFKTAEQKFKENRFTEAIDAYKKAYNSALPGGTGKKQDKLGTKGYIQMQLGLAYEALYDLNSAKQSYDKAIKLKYDSENPEILLYLADLEKSLGYYQDAKKHYEEYYGKTNDIRGKQGAESCEISLELTKNPTRYKVEEQVALNTEEFDMSPTYVDRKYSIIMFTSNRPSSTGTELTTTGETKDIYISERNKLGHWGEPKIIEGPNSPEDEGTVTVNRKGDEMYFTRCVVTDEKNAQGCDIWFSEEKSKRWTEGEKIVFKPEGMDSLGIGHPALSPDGKYMVFSANLPGGHGGQDIWMSEYDRREKKWMAPVNLGPTVNSAGNELFPYIRSNGELYIASDGHAGLGGLDIFKCESTGDKKWGKPANMGSPINSNSHDYGIIFEGDDERGLFTSNRKGKTKDDIYSFNLPPKIFKLTTVVLNEKTKEPIQGVNISIDGSDGSSFTVSTDENGIFVFENKPGGGKYINEEVNYTITVEKEGEVLKTQDAITTVGLNESTDFIKEFLVVVIDEKTVIRLPEVRYDYDSHVLQVNDSVNSKDSLNYLYNLMVENPTIIVQLRSHTDCRGSDAYNRKLAQRRAQSCVDYLVDEKGIAKERLVPLGRGEDEPLPGLGCNEIERLPTRAEKEAAHQLNRRTDCKILSWDYVPKDDN